MSAPSSLPVCRWGIIATGEISSYFVRDLLTERGDEARATHIIQAIGSSSQAKGQRFAAQHCPGAGATIYGSYAEVYADPAVDCVYIGTPHAMHRRNCLDAIAAGKHVLCEKAFMMNAAEAREVIAAARAKGSVYLAEAMWLRHRPLVRTLVRLLHEEKIIGEVLRMHSDFPYFVDVARLPRSSRYKDPALGAGSLLDIGVYSLTWACLALEEPRSPSPTAKPRPLPQILATQSFHGDVEVTSGVLLNYRATGRQGVVSSTLMASAMQDCVCRIQGTEGYIDVDGDAPALPSHFTVYKRQGVASDANRRVYDLVGQRYEFPHAAMGFVFEADNAAIDIAAGRTESPIMPLDETLRMMEMMDEIRRQGGARFPQDGSLSH